MNNYTVRDLISHRLLWVTGCTIGTDCDDKKEPQMEKEKKTWMLPLQRFWQATSDARDVP
jgi:hypothetical protein